MKAPAYRLTKKQQLVIELFACDYNVPEAAVKTGIAQCSIEKIVERAKLKFGVRHAQGLVSEAIRHGCINMQGLRKEGAGVVCRGACHCGLVPQSPKKLTICALQNSGDAGMPQSRHPA